MSQNQIHDRGRFLGNLIYLARLYSGFIQCSRRASGSVNDIAKLLKAACHLDGLPLVRVFHRNNHLFMLRETHARAEKRLVERLVKGLCNAKALTGGLHFRPKADLRTPDLLKGKYRHLDGKIVRRRL